MRFLSIVVVDDDDAEHEDQIINIGGLVPPDDTWEQEPTMSIIATTERVEDIINNRAGATGMVVTSVVVKEDKSGRLVTIMTSLPAEEVSEAGKFYDLIQSDLYELSRDEGAKIALLDVQINTSEGVPVQRCVNAYEVGGGYSTAWIDPAYGNNESLRPGWTK